MSHDVFISYASEDAATANRIFQFLQGRGIRCWIDKQDLRFGGKYDRAIEQAIHRSRVVLWLASPHSLASDYVKFEIATATNCRTTIGPIYLESMDPSRLPAPFNLKLANVQGIEWFKQAEDVNLQKLAAEVKGLIRGLRVRQAALAGGIVAVALVALTIGFLGVLMWSQGEEPGRTRSHVPLASTSPQDSASMPFPQRLEQLPAADILKIAYAASPPNLRTDAERPGLGLEILARRHTESNFARLNDGDSLSSQKDDYLLVVRPETAGFLYVFQVDTVGKKTWLFPKNETSAYSSGYNPVKSGKVLQVPSAESERVLFLDKSQGIEHIYTVFSATQWPELERALSHAEVVPTRSDEKRADAPLSQTLVESPNGLLSRGVGGTRPVPGDASVSFVVQRTEAQGNWSLPVSTVPIRANGAFLVVERWFRHVGD